ncbi:unnamed protein product [Prunus brigantina]
MLALPSVPRHPSMRAMPSAPHHHLTCKAFDTLSLFGALNIVHPPNNTMPIGWHLMETTPLRHLADYTCPMSCRTTPCGHLQLASMPLSSEIPWATPF